MQESDQSDIAADDLGKPAGKGRPTPKRSEVERRRREPAPTDRKTASTQDRQARRAEYARRTEAQRRGEEWALNPRDRGPVKALARDYVDSQRLIVSEYILFAVFAVIIGIFILGAAKNGSIILFVELGIVALITAESLYHGMRVSRLAKKRLPGASTRGLTWYVAKRSIRLRSSRLPPARVTRGQAI